MKAEPNALVMDDGTRYYAHGSIIGLAEDMQVTYGYDGVLHFDGYYYDDEPPVKEAHRKEIADYMIALWTKYREGHSAAEGSEGK